ncbi:MAG: SDR family NAD(P)-dependent oxidoreductase [Acetobacteraceae bacterium]|nr:SDR family NAD(P)-dependent oxidoreductase [Acetobacteraceae bacterium]
MNLDGQAAIVTGGGSGLGEATALRLAASGCRVAVLDLNGAAAQVIAGQIGGVSAGCDVGDEANTEAAFAAAGERHGPARLLVNCAGVAPAARIVGRGGPMRLAEFEGVIRVNLIGTFNTLRLAAAEMRGLDPEEDGERGVIINTASIAGYEGQVGQAAYAASKAGVIGLTLQAARELAPYGIRVVTIAPGLMWTPMLEAMPEEIRHTLAGSVPFPSRLGMPEEFASLVVHIVQNRYLNGETIRLDGALRMPPR